MPDCQLRLSSPLSRSCGAVPTGVATDTGGGAGADVGLELEPKLAFPPPRFFLLLPLLPPPPLRFAPMAPPTPLPGTTTAVPIGSGRTCCALSRCWRTSRSAVTCEQYTGSDHRFVSPT